jgi:hypothetical protein
VIEVAMMFVSGGPLSEWFKWFADLPSVSRMAVRCNVRAAMIDGLL